MYCLAVIHCFDQPFGTGNETDSPSGHCIRLRHTVHDNHTVMDFRELGNAFVLADVIDVLVDFICYHIYLRMLCQYCCQAANSSLL